MAQKPNSGLGHHVFEVSRSHTIKHVHSRTPLNKEINPVAEDSNYTTYKKHNRRTGMPSTGFEPAIPQIKRSQTYTLESTTIGVGIQYYWCVEIKVDDWGGGGRSKHGLQRIGARVTF
jgi:hypothetical protein